VRKEVLAVARIRHTAANEIAQASALLLDRFRDAPVLIAGHSLDGLDAQFRVHLRVKTFGTKKYCREIEARPNYARRAIVVAASQEIARPARAAMAEPRSRTRRACAVAIS